MSTPSNQAWMEMTRKMPKESWGIAAALFPWRNQIALIGSRGLRHTFNVDDQTCQELPQMIGERFCCGAMFYRNRLFVVGGWYRGNDLDSMEVLPFDSEGKPSQQGWQSMPRMITKRTCCGAAIIGDTIFVVGGWDGKQPLRSAEAFHLKENRWVSLPDMTEYQEGCAAASVKDCLYVFGGHNGRKHVNTAEMFDTKTNTWRALPNMPQARSFVAAVVVGEKIFIMGGKDNNEKHPRKVDVFDTITMQWQTEHPFPKLSTGRCACGAVYNQGKIMVFGGYDQNRSFLNTIETINVEGPPDYSEYATRADVVAEIAKLKAQYNEKSGGDEFDPQVILQAQQFHKELSHLESLCSRMPTVEELRTQISTLEDRMRPLRAPQEFDKCLPLSIKRKKLLEQLQKEEEAAAADEPPSQPPMIMFGKSTWATKLLRDGGIGRAKVYCGIRRLKSNAKQEVAIKVFDPSDQEDWQDELRNLLRLPYHPNVVDVLEFYQIPKPAIVMEYIKGGDLQKHLDTHGPFAGSDANELLLGIGEGLRHLHEYGVVHRDVKPGNILMERRGIHSLRPVLIDLGLGRIMANDRRTGITADPRGTTAYMAPEMLRDMKWNEKTDMYSLGIVMWEVLTGRNSFQGLYGCQITTRVIVGERPDMTLLDEVGVSEGQRSLIQALWSEEAADRPSAEEFVERIPRA